MNDDTHPAIRAAMQVAKQIYAVNPRPSDSEIDEMVDLALHVFPTSDTGADRKTIILMTSGMLNFAAHVEQVNGIDFISAMAQTAKTDARVRAAMTAGAAAYLSAIAEELDKTRQD